MILSIWRHGEAGRAATDRERELTNRGRAEVGSGADAFARASDARRLGLPAAIYHSPWRRTTSTAAILAGSLNGVSTVPLSALQPGGDTAGVEAALPALQEEHGDGAHLLLVSHQPLVSRLVEHFLGESGAVPSLSPGSFAVLRLEVAARGCAELVFYGLPPAYEVSV